jgi:hypothetical protein
MKNTRVLISGASIAGPALAFWLNGYGFDVTIRHHHRGRRHALQRPQPGPCRLAGDAAYGNALGGFGTGLAIVGAYVLDGVEDARLLQDGARLAPSPSPSPRSSTARRYRSRNSSTRSSTRSCLAGK